MSTSHSRLQFPERIRRLKTLPVLPTILTSGNVACGVTAIMCAAHDKLLLGAVLIFAAMLCDLLDGKVARLTHTEGAFGAELDSLADIVSFGVAPAMLVHRLVLEKPGVFAPEERLIWLVTVFYAVMAAIRLAKYNVEHEDGKATTHFSGLPSPGAAALLCAWVIAYEEYLPVGSSPLLEQTVKLTLVGITTWCAILMVSNVPFPHIGNTLLGQRLSFRRAMLLILGIFLVFWKPVILLPILTTSYALYGFIPSLWRAWHRWMAGKALLDEDEDEDDLADFDDEKRQGSA